MNWRDDLEKMLNPKEDNPWNSHIIDINEDTFINMRHRPYKVSFFSSDMVEYSCEITSSKNDLPEKTTTKTWEQKRGYSTKSEFNDFVKRMELWAAAIRFFMPIIKFVEPIIDKLLRKK